MDGYLQARQEVPVESDEMWHLAVCCLLTVFGVKCEVFAWYGGPRCNPDMDGSHSDTYVSK